MGDDRFAGARKLQWTVKGIDPEVRELSRKAARKSGMRMGSWVETVLRGAALNELEDRPSSELQLRSDMFEKINIIEASCRRSEESSRMISEIQKDIHLLQRGLLQKVLQDKT